MSRRMATPTTTAMERRHPKMVYGEVMSFAYETFCSNKVRFALTALGMVIGTASLILVVTIGMTGKQYVLNQIQSIGTNQIEAEYQSGGQRIANVTPDPLTIEDMNAVLQEVPGIVAASPVVPLGERIPVGGGKERDISVLGVYSDYRIVRNLVVITGRLESSRKRWPRSYTDRRKKPSAKSSSSAGCRSLSSGPSGSVWIPSDKRKLSITPC